MKMDKVAGSGNDEFYTPEYAVTPIAKYLAPPAVIWCPFDTEDSLFVKHFRAAGYTVLATHICNGQDFLLWRLQTATTLLAIRHIPLKVMLLTACLKSANRLQCLLALLGYLKANIGLIF